MSASRILIFILLFSFATQTLAASLLNGNLVAHWRFDEVPASFALDSSGNGNSGTYASVTSGFYPLSIPSAPGIKFGEFKRALVFPSSPINGLRLSAAAAASIDTLNDMTATFWVNRSSAQSGTVYLLNKATGSGLTGWRIVLSNGGLQGRRGTTGSSANTATNYSPPVDTWAHITATYSSSTKKLSFFVNGVETSYASQSTATGDPLDDSAARLAAATYSGATNPFWGLMDDIRVYNRVLSSAEITDIASGNMGATDPVLWWKLDESNFVYPHSGFSEIGYYIGSPVATTSASVHFYNPRALALNSSIPQYVTATRRAKTATLGDLTFSGWVKPTSTSTATYIVDKSNASGAAGWKIYMTAAQKITASRDLATGTDPSSVSTNTVPLNTWTHLTVKYNNTAKNFSIYLNGTEVTYDSQTSGTGANSSDSGNDFHIGYVLPLGSYWNGGLDDFRLYNRVLTDAEIASLGGGLSPGTVLKKGVFYKAIIK